MCSWRRSGSILLWLALALLGCGNVTTEVPADVVDASRPDAPAVDAPAVDASAVDAPAVDASAVDASAVDASVVDASAVDASAVDAAAPDASPPDAGLPDASPPDASPPDAAVPAFDGVWTGTTSQARPLSFTVVNNGITMLSFEWVVPACGVAGRTTTTFNIPLPISASGTFSANVSSVPLSYAISGALGSTAGTGTFTFNFSDPLMCTGSSNATWSVTR